MAVYKLIIKEGIMRSFSDIQPINITHEGFDRNLNGQYFQTKDLDMEYGMSEYYVFNGQLYQNMAKAGAGSEAATPVVYTGTIDIYASVKENDDKLIYWVEYQLQFETGKLRTIELLEKVVQEDLRDLSKLRPAKPSNRVEVTISVKELSSERQQAFAATLTEEKMSSIRKIIGEPTASIFFPAVTADYRNNDSFFRYPAIMTVASVVQSIEDFRSSDDGSVNVISPSGDRVVLIDELYSKNGSCLFNPVDRQTE